MQTRPDIRRLDKAVIDTKDEDQRHFSDEEKTEEESQTLDRFLASALERIIIDLVHSHADEKERRYHDDADQDRIDAEIGIDEISDKRPEHYEGRVRDIDDVEHAERDRHADCDRGIKAAEQEPDDDLR